MMLIHPPVNPYSPAGEIREWIQVLERWRAEPMDDTEDLWFVDSQLTTAREWLDRAETKERSASA
jgi:hypothetical protein